MRCLLPLLAGLLALSPLPSAFAAVGPVDTRVRLNSIGFTPRASKEATIAATATRFRVLRVSDDAVVLEGDLGAAIRTAVADTDESVQIARFTALETPGDYQLDIPGVGRSAPFSIREAVFNEAYRASVRAFYLWRCGTAVSGNWQGRVFSHAACHLDDGWLDYVGGGSAKADGTGGWHDAGDYNKYVVNAGVTVGLLFKAWEHFGSQIAVLPLDLPESGNATPDLLDEIRWELEWLFKMQVADGRVYHKLSARNFDYWGVPEKDPSLRYFVPWSTAATADFAAMMALGARHFRGYDAAFADRCLAAARLAWGALEANPTNVDSNQTGFDTGGYVTNDAVHRLWAAAELHATTGEAKFLQFFETGAADRSFSNIGPGWSDVLDLALGTYLETPSAARNTALLQRLRTNLFAQAGSIVQTVETHAYGRGMGGTNWWWGVNGSVAGQTYLLHLANRLQPDARYRAAAEETIGYLLGRNYHNRSYVTGLGHQPPEHPHDRRGEPAWPGYLVGGGHPNGRSWKDVQSDYEQNEIAINWNGALAYALAGLVGFERPTPAYDWAPFVRGTSTIFQPVFTVSGQVTYRATGLPAWATLNPATGAISGVHAGADHTSVVVDAVKDGAIAESRIVNLMSTLPGGDIRPINMASRGMGGRDERQMIVGFVCPPNAQRRLLVRAVGPGLAKHDVPGWMTNPQLTYISGATTESNDDWPASLTDEMKTLGADALAPGSKDAALAFTTGGGTALTQDLAGGTGVVLVEAFDANPDDRSSSLVNLSTRAQVGTDANVLISGVVLRGGGTARLLVRAVGPPLASRGITDPLKDPVLTIYSGQTALATNDNWGSAGDAAEIAAATERVGATPALPFGSTDSAMIIRLPEGGFTLNVSGKNRTTGIVVLEVYVLP